MAEYTLEEIAAAVGGTVEGDQSAVVSGLSGIEEAGPDDVTFVANPKYESLLKTTKAGAVILGEGVAAPDLNVVRVADAYVAFAKVLAMFAPEPALPEGFSLSQNYPNPFNPETTISYDVAKTGTVRLSVYALTGQVVRTLVDGGHAAGSYTVTWDGTDDTGHPVASGVYLCRMVAGQYSAVRKLVLMK